jgi:hypothetical protein
MRIRGLNRRVIAEEVFPVAGDAPLARKQCLFHAKETGITDSANADKRPMCLALLTCLLVGGFVEIKMFEAAIMEARAEAADIAVGCVGTEFATW